MALPLQKHSRASLILFILFASLFVSSFQTVNAVPSEPFLEISIAGKNVVFYPESVDIQVRSNISPTTTINIYNETLVLVYSQIRVVNSTFNYIPPENYGKYTVHATIGTYQTETWFWVQDTRNLSALTLPYSWNVGNIQYILLSNCTLKAVDSTSSKGLSIDWISEIAIKLKPEITAYKNDAGLIKITTNGKDITASSWLMDTYFGEKIRVNGTLKSPTTLKWNYKAFGGTIAWSLDSARVGNLVYDYSDFSRSVGCIATIDKTGMKTDVYLSTSFDIDPYIFESGFETGNFSEWSGTSATTPTIVTSPVHHGTYAAKSLNGYSRYYYVAASTYTDAFFRGYFCLPEIKNNGIFLLRIADSAWENSATVGLYVSGATKRWYLYTSTGNYELDAFTFSANEWFEVELERKIGTGSNGVVTLWVNDIQMAQKTSETYTTNSKAFFASDVNGLNDFIIYGDCFVINTSHVGLEANDYDVGVSLSTTLAKSAGIAWNSLVSTSKTLTASFAETIGWASKVATTKALTSSFLVGEAWSSTVGTILAMSSSYLAGHVWVSIVATSLGLTGSWIITIPGAIVNVGLSLGTMFSTTVGMGWNSLVSAGNNFVSSWLVSPNWESLASLSSSYFVDLAVSASLGVEIIVGVAISILASFGVAVCLITPFEMVGILAFVLAIVALALVVIKK